MGSILFLVYINDFNEYIKNSTLRLFADDSIIYNTIRNKEDTNITRGSYISSKMREGMGHVVHIQTSASCNNYENPLLLLWYCQNKNGIGVWHRVHYIDMWHRYRYIGI